MDDIESLEQALLQHIRVAGLIKSREFSIIEEILDIRKKRRQLYSSLIAENNQIQRELEDVKTSSHSSIENLHISHKNKLESMETLLNSKQSEIHQLQEIYRSDKYRLEENHKRDRLDEIAKLKSKYSQNLSKLESRIEALQESNLCRDNEQQSVEIINALTEKHKISANRYKEALLSVVDKERKLISTVESQSKQIEELQAACSSCQSKLISAETQIQELQRRVHESESRQKSAELKLQRTAETARREKNSCQCEMENLKAISNEALQEIRLRHESELEYVNEKVRAALTAKEDAIQKLKQHLAAAEARYMEAEALIENLNSGISSASAPSISAGQKPNRSR